MTEDKDITFHRTVVKLIFLYKYGRPDLQTSIFFIMIKVKALDAGGQRKLYCVIKYPCFTIDLVLNLEAGKIGTIIRWVNISFTTNFDMKRYTS